MSVAKEIAEQLEIFSLYLKERGLRMTSQRELVARSFLQAKGHLSAEELYTLAKGNNPRVGFTTVFRTLNTLVSCGLATEVRLNDGRKRFERLYNRPRHHHLVCVRCNRTIEFLGPELEQLKERISSRYHFQLLQPELRMLGICRKCNTGTSENSETVRRNGR